MKEQIFNISDWGRFCAAMNRKLSLKFKAFEIEVKPVKDAVSRSQQCYIYGVVYPRLKQALIDSGYEIENITDEQFDYFMREMFYFDVVKTRRGERKLPRRLCFSKAKKNEVSLYISDLIMFAAKIGCYIPPSADFI